MELIKWSDKYSVGIEEIDNQHKGLVIIINELFALMLQGKAKSNLDTVFEHLADYIDKHFFSEETMLAKYAYPDYDEHKGEHLTFIEKLQELKKDFQKGKVTISIEVLNFLKDWLLNHIQISDRKYSTFIINADKNWD